MITTVRNTMTKTGLRRDTLGIVILAMLAVTLNSCRLTNGRGGVEQGGAPLA
jgi:hypothetical protein